MEQDIESLEGCLKALADRTRLRILKLLQEGPLCGCHLAAVLGFTAATVSNHLALLAEAGFVRAEKRGRWVFHTLAPGHPAAASLLSLLPYWLREDARAAADRKRLAAALAEMPCA